MGDAKILLNHCYKNDNSNNSNVSGNTISKVVNLQLMNEISFKFCVNESICICSICFILQ